MSISNKVITGKSGARNMLASKMYDNSYYFIGLGNKSELTIQGFEKNLKAALKEINSYKISTVSIDLTNLKIKNFDIINASIIEIEKSQYSYKGTTTSELKICALKISSALNDRQFKKLFQNRLQYLMELIKLECLVTHLLISVHQHF